MPRKTLKRTTAKKRTITKRTTKKKQLSVPLTVKRYVKSAIHRLAENKIAENYGDANLALSPYNPTSQLSTIIALHDVMNLQQGTGQGQRVGNKISVRRLMLMGHILPQGDGTNVQPSQLVVRHVIFRQKQSIDIPTSLADIFQSGNASTAPTNTLTDMYWPLNRDDYRIFYDKIYKISDKTIDIHMTNVKIFKIDLMKFVPKTIQYNDNAVDPTNVGLYNVFFVSPYGEDLTTSVDSQHPIMTCSYNVEFQYEDL